MFPTLADGQWVLVWKGADRVRNGDIALFINPDDEQFTVKRCVLNGIEKPQIKHGWLITSWGTWYLTGDEWKNLIEMPKPAPDSVFMIGDNQFNSWDSRQYGYIKRNKLLGRVLYWKRHG